MIPFARMLEYGNVAPERIRITKMDAGTDHIALLYSNGELYTRGNGGAGRLGTGNTISNYTSWSLVLTDVKDVWCGNSFTIALKKDNTFWLVGNNNPFGTTGNFLTWTERTSFFTDAGVLGSDIKQIELGSNSMYVLSRSNILYIAGRNLGGELGTGTASAVTQLTYKDSDVQLVSYCNDFAAYSKLDGTLYRSGYGAFYQRGDGSTDYMLSSTVLPAPNNMELIEFNVTSRDVYYLYRNKSTGISSLYVNGTNSSGELGLNSTSIVPVQTTSSIYDGRVLSVKTRYSLLHKMIYTVDGVYSSGANNTGQCGVGNTNSISVFTKCVGLPEGEPQYMLPFNEHGTMISIKDSIFWCGSNAQFIGGTGVQNTFIKLSTPYN